MKIQPRSADRRQLLTQFRDQLYPSGWQVRFPRCVLALAIVLVVAQTASAAVTNVWTGASGTDTNWSNGNNWSTLAVPTGDDDVKFFDPGAVATIGVVSNVVDASFGGYIGSLHYGNTNNNHTTLIQNGVTLNITNIGGLVVGTLADNGSAQQVNATVTGAGTLNVSNGSALIYISQGKSVNANGSLRATLDLTGLDNFVVTANRIAVGARNGGGPNNIQNTTGTLKLARTNLLALSLSAGTGYTNFATAASAIDVGEDDGNTGGVNFLYLGQTNAFFVDTVSVGKTKTTSTMLFNPAFTGNSPVAYFRGTNGDASRVTFWTIGDMQSSGSSSSFANGTNDFSGGIVDALVETMSLGRDRNGGNTGTTTTRGTLTFTAGTIDVNKLLVGNQAFTATGNTNSMQGVVNVNGSAATLVVNNNLVLGNTTVNSTAANRTSGILNIRGGTVLANLISIGTFSSATNVITMTNATLVLSNTLASPAKGLSVFNLTNSTLRLNVTGVTNIVVTNLVTGGLTNIIDLASVDVFTSYPTQVTLIKYSGTGIGGAGFNFGFGANALPGSAPGATLVDNSANKSIDLLLPADPRPVITNILNQPVSVPEFPNPGDDVVVSIGISSNTVLPVSYQWYLDAVPLTDGPTGNGSTNSGSTTASLMIFNSQTNDSGTYTVVITNVYGSATSAALPLTISTNPVPPAVFGLTDQTVIQGDTATLVTTVSGKPKPILRWQFNSNDLADGPTGNGDIISGSTNSTLTIANAQYPASQGTYSLIASNEADIVTNSAVLTVIVRPSISSQPVSVVVTNTQAASFSVTAAGVPTPGYQWYKNGSPISTGVNPTANSDTLSIASASPADIGSYFVAVTNAAGTSNSVTVTLTVTSVGLTAVSLSPSTSATGLCYDTPLYVTFSQTPVLRNAGKIRIYNSTDSVTPVDTLDLSLNSLTGVQPHGLFSGDSQPFNYYPVIVTGTTAAIYPHSGVMTSNQTYYVTVDTGVFADSAGAYFTGITDTNAWQFTTKPTGPANPTNIVVTADGSGDFVTVQGAVDSVLLGNTTYTLINVRDGNYVEIVNISGKHNVTFRGQSRAGTIVGYANNANIAPSGTTHARMAFKINANDIAIENMTVTNRTPVGGSQAEAVMVESNARRFIFNYASMGSYQDTFLANVNSSQAYVYNSLVTGQFDYLWGGGNCFFTNTEIRTLIGANGSGSGNLVATRTDATPTGNWPGFLGLSSSNGFSFVGCRLTRDPGVTNITLAGSNGTTNGVAAWINCSIDTNCYRAPQVAAANSELLWEFGNSNLNNTVATPPYAGVVQLTAGDPRLLAAQNSTIWLNGWVPQLAPNIVSQPTNRTFFAGQTATLTVVATGIPDPTYQWLRDGTNVLGQTNATLTIPNAQGPDGDTYSVVVSNASGTVTSSTATLTIVPAPPAFVSPPPNSIFVINVGVDLSVTNIATDGDLPPQTVTLSLLSTSPTNATFDAGTGIFAWRPLTIQANTTNVILVVATDDGVPSLSTTNSFTVIVNPLTSPTITSPTYSGGQFSLSVIGQLGPDYALQATTNL